MTNSVPVLRVLALMAALLAVMPREVAAQQPTSVRAIEHPEFSRLVLSLPPNVEPSLIVDGASARLSLAGEQVEYDFSGVFDRMPRDRIRAVNLATVGTDTIITLSLGCSCTVQLEPIGSRFLAVDVRRGADYSRRWPQFSSPEPAIERTAEETEVARPASPPAPTPVAPVASSGVEAEAPVTVEVARDALVQQLDRAIEQGLLSLAPMVEDGAPEIAVAEAVQEVAEPVQVPQPVSTVQRPAPAEIPAQPGKDTLTATLSAQNQVTVRDTPTNLEPSPDDAPEVREIVAQCAFDTPLDTQRWSFSGTEFTDSLGMARLGVTDATGTVSKEGVLDLARLYISHGMGREVVSLL
ncbi:MAG: hypothetical protein AAGF22_01235, partial [Pseudomonadota bacterium]